MDAENLSRTFRERRKLYEDFTKSLSQLLKDLIGSARIAPAELFEQLYLSALDRAQPALDAALAREALTPLAGPLESRGARQPPLVGRRRLDGGCVGRNRQRHSKHNLPIDWFTRRHEDVPRGLFVSPCSSCEK